MSDTLEVFGVEYSGVNGIKAKDSNGNTLTYTRNGSSATLGTKSITANGTYNASSDNYDGYSSVTVNVPSQGASLQSKTNITPTTSSQTITPDSGYDGLSSVQINAMPSGTAGTPTATKGTVSNHSVTVTPSVTNTTGYITGSTINGTAVTVSASELDSGTKSISANGTGIDVVGYAAVDVEVANSGPENAYRCQLIQDNQGRWYPGFDTYADLADIYTEIPVDFYIMDSSYDVSQVFKTSTAFHYTVLEPTEETIGNDTVYAMVVSVYSFSSNGVTEDDNYIYYDTYDADAVASNVTSGKVFYTSTGRVVGTATGPSLQAKTNITPTTSSQTITADSGYDGLSSVQINAISNTYVGSEITRRTGTDLYGQYNSSTDIYSMFAPAGYYENTVGKNVPNADTLSHIVEKSTVSNNSVTVTPKIVIAQSGYITNGTKTGTATTVTASELVSGTKNISANGSGIDVRNYAYANVSVSPTLQAKTGITPTTSSQTITADSSYDGLSSVQINAMPSGTAGTPTATKGSVSNHSISVTPSVTNTTGYITGSTKTGTAVTVTASELASGNKAITDNGTGIDVVGYSTVSVAVPFSTITVSSSSPSGGSNGDVWIKTS